MANSSPPARLHREARPSSANRLSYPWATNVEFDLENLSLEHRNSEESHLRSLAHAREFHAGLRKTAIDVLNHYHIQEEQRQIKLEQEREEARLRAEAELAAERQRLQALKAKSIPIPPPPAANPEPPKQTENAKNAAPPTPSSNESAAQTSIATKASQGPSMTKTPSLAQGFVGSNASANSAAATPAAPAKEPPPSSTQPPPSTTNTVNGLNSQPRAPAPSLKPTPPPSAPQVVKPDRHFEIHKKLKQLRAFMEEQRKSNPQLKNRMGDMRREIRKSMGQLVEGSMAQNKLPIQKITACLREALKGGVPSQPVDPNEFLLEPRQASPGTLQLPSLYIYLLNIFSKATISQFINECGAKPQAADPIGTVIAKIFSDPEFQWGGGSMIDILLAKYRVVCPVVFGFRGNDRTEQGRLRVGWWKDPGGSWIPEQTHVDRMTGLGAGFAAIALRDFSRSKNQNPYPPSKYWAALARIINTPANEVSDTQCYVLKAMIENFEPRFIHFYGTAAIAALRVALVEFPAKLQTKSAAVSALPVLAQILKRDAGLALS